MKPYLQQGTGIIWISAILVAQLAAGSRIIRPNAQERPRRRVPLRQLGQLGGRVKRRQRHLTSPSNDMRSSQPIQCMLLRAKAHSCTGSL